MNYDTHDKELLAIITALEHWRLFLELTKIPITVYTDHRNLEYWKNAKIWNRRHARWHQLLASFNFHIVYRAGKLSDKPDALSRRSDHKDIPNQAQIMIASEKFQGFAAETTEDIISAIQEAQSDDESMETLIASTKDKENLPPSIRKQYHKYEWRENLLWYEGRILVPDNKDIKLRILGQHHDSPIAGHQGQARTLELVSRKYYWAGMKMQVNNYVDSCEICQRSKGAKKHSPLKNMGIPDRPWEEINYDFIVKLPISGGFDSILVVIDRFSRQAHFIPCHESTNAEELANIFIREVWKHHGLPRRTISDRGSTFNSHFLRALYKKLDIEPGFSTAYHPETDGLAERTNQWLEGFLRSFCNYQQNDWVKWLPIAEFCHNNQENSATGKTAFETIYGAHPRWDMSGIESNVPEANNMEQHMQEVWDEVKASMEYHQKAENDLRQEFKVGDKVWLVTTNIQTKRPMKKLDNKKIGPFTISEKISSHAYRLDLPKTMRIHNVFHINLLSASKEDSDFHRRQVRPPPVITEEGEEEYKVEKIITWEQVDKGKKKGLYYQVRWEGYGPEEDTLERAEKIAELGEVMHSFLVEHPNAPTPRNYKRPKTSIKEEGREADFDISSISDTQLHQSTPSTNQPQEHHSKPGINSRHNEADHHSRPCPLNSPLPPASLPLLPPPGSTPIKSQPMPGVPGSSKDATSGRPTSWPRRSTPRPYSTTSRWGTAEGSPTGTT
jgi:transposase InsO family protein